MSISVTDGNRRNIDVVQGISEDLEELAPDEPTGAHDYPDLITFVEDGPEHDQRYAMVPGRIRCEQGWSPVDTFESGIRKTMKWYLEGGLQATPADI